MPTQIVIYRDGELTLKEGPADGPPVETYSITKSFLAIGILACINNGTIDSVDDPVSKYIKGWSYGKKKDVTIKQILTHTSSLDRYWDYDSFMTHTSLADLTLSIDASGVAGRFYYNNTATQVLPILIEGVEHSSADEFLHQTFFSHQGIEHNVMRWKKDFEGTCYGPNGLSMNAMELAKVGLNLVKATNKLFLEMFKEHVSFRKRDSSGVFTGATGYGYMIWIYNDWLVMAGIYGQFLAINREKKIVAVRLTDEEDGPPYSFEQFIEDYSLS